MNGYPLTANERRIVRWTGRLLTVGALAATCVLGLISLVSS